MTNKQAAKIGGKQGLIAAIIGVVLAQLIIFCLFPSKDSFMVFSSNIGLSVAVGIAIFLLCGYLFGRAIGVLVFTRRCHPAIAGPLAAMIALLITSVLGGWFSAFQDNSANDAFYEYIIPCIMGLGIFGFIPAIAVGFRLGYRIKKLVSATEVAN